MRLRDNLLIFIYDIGAVGHTDPEPRTGLQNVLTESMQIIPWNEMGRTPSYPPFSICSFFPLQHIYFQLKNSTVISLLSNSSNCSQIHYYPQYYSGSLSGILLLYYITLYSVYSVCWIFLRHFWPCPFLMIMIFDIFQ